MGYQFDLGRHSRQISTASSEAQEWFDRGLNWVYAFNQEEGIECFKKALAADANCAMAHWGIAYATGPFYNRPWIRFTKNEIAATLAICFQAIRSAAELSNRCTDVERSLIDALSRRYQNAHETDVDTLQNWQQEFTAAMRDVHTRWPDDLDVAALFVEAGITCTPRMLWNLETGQPIETAHTREVVTVLDRAMAVVEASTTPHPAIPHLQIHTLEMSPNPERALPAADTLRGLIPDGGHLQHMPAHIYVLCGDYAQAVEQSRLAVAANDKYVDHAGVHNFYTTARCHDLHLYMYAAMFLGQYTVAIQAADKICEEATPELIDASVSQMAVQLDVYAAMRTHVKVRFGKWRELVDEPPVVSPEHTPITAVMQLYGKGVAHSALGEVNEARETIAAFREGLAGLDPEAVMFSNTVTDVLGVADAMLVGELEYRKENYDVAFEQLRLAVARDDRLNFTEPWAWMHPPRHALGALLSEQGRFEEAEHVFRQDLGLEDDLPRCCQHPDNIWAMLGLLECLEHRDDVVAATALRKKLQVAQRYSDATVTTACCCRRSTS